MCLSLYVFMCVRFYVSMCVRVRVHMWLYMASVCLFVICMRQLCVCLIVRVCACACVAAFFVVPGVGRDACWKPASTQKRPDDRRKQNKEKTRLHARTRVHDNTLCKEIVADIF